MKTETRLDLDRSRWSNGPWHDEPDKIEWRYKGIPCLIVRNHGGALCGYAGIEPEHSLYGVDYDTAYERLYVDIHGGLTYSAKCSGNICHKPMGWESDDIWWLGFDCAHCDDVCPALNHMFGPFPGAEYRDVKYVTAEVERLADALKAFEG